MRTLKRTKMTYLLIPHPLRAIQIGELHQIIDERFFLRIETINITKVTTINKPT